ncbi:MAG: DUF6734 family protein [Cyanobacteria bacterium J06635_1]
MTQSLSRPIAQTMAEKMAQSAAQSVTQTDVQPLRRSVWSFWTKPFRAHHNRLWFSEKHHLLAWILSLELARQHYPDTVLMTDDHGARLLIDGLGLAFDTVSTSLNHLEDQDPDWWVLGKLWAYRQQTQPFIHIDTDVFLWQPLPAGLTQSPVFAQSPEHFIFGDNTASTWWYRPEVYEQKVKETNGWLPVEWQWYLDNRRTLAFNTGIIGGQQIDFINHYADMAVKVATNSRNQVAFSRMDCKTADCILIEQYLLAACAEYHQQHSRSPFQAVTINCLFESPEAAYTPANAKRVGYTHMIGYAKRDPKLAKRLEQRVKQDFPVQYERCLRYLKRS